MQISIVIMQQAHLCQHFLLTTVSATENSITMHSCLCSPLKFQAECQVMLPVKHPGKTLVLEMFMTVEV